MTSVHPARREHDSFVGRDAYLALNGTRGPYAGGVDTKPPRRRRRLQPSKPLLCVIAGVTALVGSVSVYGFGGPWSPEGAVRLFTGAIYLEDYEAAFDLLCRSRQEAYGSSDAYAFAEAPLPGEAPFPRFVLDGDARWNEAADSWSVPVRSPDLRGRAFLVVTQEDGDYRICGQHG